MIRERALALLEQVAAGTLPASAVLDLLAAPPLESLEFATIDHHRALRQGYPEVIFAQGKTVAQVVAIAERIAERGDGFLVTRAAPEVREALAERFTGCQVNELGRTAHLPGSRRDDGTAWVGPVCIVTAGTADLPVAEEAAVTVRAFGAELRRVTDVGVAGLHRVLASMETIGSAAAIIVVAGMDGALPSVIGGLISGPVIAVPTSVGYGASFGGVAALLAMLNSCSAGVTVVNIDNGFGAAAAACRIARRSATGAP